jgi:hypothetical protein
VNTFQKTVSVVLLFLVTALPFSTSAYTLAGYTWPTSVSGLSYKWGSNLQTSGGLSRTAFESAISDWNGTATKVFFSNSTGSSNILDTYYKIDSTDYGVTNVTSSGSSIVCFTSEINVGNTNVVNTTNVARSAAGHELGHGLGLAHTSSTALMNQNRDRTKIYTPQSDDINGVNSMY